MSADKPKEPPVQIEPNPKDQRFFEWLEELYDGTTQFPERLETRVITGRNGERLGPMIDQILYAPQPKEEKDKEKENGKPSVKARGIGKPSREELVALSNRLIFLCQRDCDQARRPTLYGVHASHFQREVDFYRRWTMKLTPQGIHAPKEGEVVGDEDGEIVPVQERYASQALAHDERMFNMYGAMVEGMIDRLDHAIQRSEAAHEATRLRLERQQEINERLATNAIEREQAAIEREQAAKWTDLKIKSVEKGLDTALAYGPPIFAQMMGKKGSGIEETPESLALKIFFKLDKDGGKLTTAQADAAFGVYDDTPQHSCIKRGVLSPEQVEVLLDVSRCVVSADDLDKLVPGGPHSIDQGQIMGLMAIFPHEQIASVIAFVGMRMQKAQQRQVESQQPS